MGTKKNKCNLKSIEKKWQRVWEKNELYKVSDRIKNKKNFYHLVMFPYPSGDLHIGHWFNFTPADVYARFKKMQGYNVLSPIGFDAFGLPAENAAIKHNIHPRNWTFKNINKMRKQLKSMGAIYDWSREVITCDPNYYKWTQWMFLQFYKKGLVYKAETPANFCVSCKTVLANEQVIEGRCERCESPVIQKKISQWLFKITDYVERLLKDLKDLDWPEKTKIMQKNWIGKRQGTLIKFQISNSKFQIEVFTTRADTLFGCTYLVLAPEHEIISNLKPQILNFDEVKRYIEESKRKTEQTRISEEKEKTGVEIKGIKAINPANGREVSVWIADYVLSSYGTGAIMAVPAHDERDFEFAKRYGLPILEAISGGDISKKAFVEDGVLINSGQFSGMNSEKARKEITEWLEKNKCGRKKINYKLRDWLISRQRYWGCPIPMVYCQRCGWQPIKENDLPVLLPKIKDFRPTGDGRSPLAKSKKFVNAVCPKCECPAKRETDTMDTFICSSWYFLRYADPCNKKQFASKQKLKDWLPVNMYIGGAEHTVLHLLYSRFFTKVLYDFKKINFKEPFLSLRHQGTILGPDGQKMSKSKGNVIDPDEQVKRYGADVVRMYLCFMGHYEQGGPWNPKGIIGIYRFLERVKTLFIKSPESKIQNPKIDKLIHQIIKKVGEDIENLRFNTAISALMILVNEMKKDKIHNLKLLKILLLLLAPFAPHLSEELWQQFKIKNSKLKTFKSIHQESWPRYDPKSLKQEKSVLIIQINGKFRDKVEVSADISEQEAKKIILLQPKIQKWLQGQEVKKIIFVPGKLFNIVI